MKQHVSTVAHPELGLASLVADADLLDLQAIMQVVVDVGVGWEG